MKPLERKTRSRLFWALVVVFIIGTPLLIGYSQGYRFNDALLLIQTGGIYLHSDMEDTTVYVNGEFVDTTGAFLRNTYIQELAPNKRYTIWVEREGYQSWVKTLPVYPNIVTEGRVLMLPTQFEWATVTASTTIQVTPATSTVPGLGKPSATSTETTVDNPEFVPESVITIFGALTLSSAPPFINIVPPDSPYPIEPTSVLPLTKLILAILLTFNKFLNVSSVGFPTSLNTVNEPVTITGCFN